MLMNVIMYVLIFLGSVKILLVVFGVIVENLFLVSNVLWIGMNVKNIYVILVNVLIFWVVIIVFV